MDAYAQILAVIIVGFIISFTLAFSVGANDAAVTPGISVGSGALTLWQALIVGIFFNTMGAVCLGNRVADTMRRLILKVGVYEGSGEQELMLGCLCAMASSCIWMIFGISCNLHVSSTHSIVSSIVGFSVVARGSKGINWRALTEVVLSWLIAPFLSALCSLLLFLAIYKFIFKAQNQLQSGLRAVPFFCGATFFVNAVSILVDNSESHVGLTPLWLAWLVSVAGSLVVAIIVVLALMSNEKFKVPNKTIGKALRTVPSQMSLPEGPPRDEEGLSRQREVLDKLFSYLQIMSTGFSNFAHGANNVGNGIGPLVVIYTIYKNGSVVQDAKCPIELLLYGSLGISVGFCLIGRCAIQSIGKRFTHLRAWSGFVIQTGSAFIVLLASKFGFPVSVIHCEISSAIVIGYIVAVFQRNKSNTSVDNSDHILVKKTKKRVTWKDKSSHENIKSFYSLESGINWKLFRYILLAWFATIPVTMLTSALAMFTLNWSLGIQ